MDRCKYLKGEVVPCTPDRCCWQRISPFLSISWNIISLYWLNSGYSIALILFLNSLWVIWNDELWFFEKSFSRHVEKIWELWNSIVKHSSCRLHWQIHMEIEFREAEFEDGCVGKLSCQMDLSELAEYTSKYFCLLCFRVIQFYDQFSFKKYLWQLSMLFKYTIDCA